MFYHGSLQEGISTAVGQQKLVLCFVTNENEESQTWENEFLQDRPLHDLIQSQAVALRLTAGSEEAGYLAQIFPLPKTPTVVIMKHGELKEYIAAGTTREEFYDRFQNAFNVPPRARSASPRAPSPSSSTSSPRSTTAPNTFGDSTASPSESVGRILAERAAKLKAEREEQERKAKEGRIKAHEKAKAEAEAGADTDAARVYKHSEELKKKKEEQLEERRRILKRIEDDKAERRLRAMAKEGQRVDNIKIGDVAASLASVPQSKLPSMTKSSDMASLQVRLFDGSTIRNRFKAASPLTGVRTWVDDTRNESKSPYTFKQVLTPRPNRNIDATEETKSLGELGLVPSSTLLLVPVQKFSSAYDGASGNIFSRFFALILDFFTWLLSLVGGSGETTRETAHDNHNEAESEPSHNRNRGVHSLHHPANQLRDQQLYNGNSLNFEPRPDDDDDER